MRTLFLVIDGSATDAERTASSLQNIDRTARVLTATTVDGGLALLEERRTVPSLIFLDAQLPDGEAIRLLNEVRAGRSWLQKAPVAMLSNSTDDRLVVTSYRLGACAFLTKPVRTFDLRDTIRDFSRDPIAMSAGTVLRPGAQPAGNAADAA